MTDADTVLADLVELRIPVPEGIERLAGLPAASTPVTITGDHFTMACDRELVRMISTSDLQAWARFLASRADVVADPGQALVLKPALAELGNCPPEGVRDVVRTWMPVLHPPRCGA